MSMKKMLAVVAAASLVAVAAPAFANPFSDVPLNHWAYDAVEELSAKGIIDGYPDGTFKGTKAMTRYEIAAVVARAIANAGDEDVEQLKALVVEFGPELEALGVKVDGFDARLAKLEKGLSGWKISGQMRFDYTSHDYDGDAEAKNTGNGRDGFTTSRARIFLHRDMANGLSFDLRLHSNRVDRYYLTARDFFGVQGLRATFGMFCYDYTLMDELYASDIHGAYDSIFMDHAYRGVDLLYDNGTLQIGAFAASNDNDNNTTGDKTVYGANESDDIYGARIRYNFNEKFFLSVNAQWYSDDGSDYQFDTYWAALGIKLADGIDLRAAYFMQETEGIDDEDDDPTSYKIILDVKQSVLKFTSLWAEYCYYDKGFTIQHAPHYFDTTKYSASDFYAAKSVGNGSAGAMEGDTSEFYISLKQQWTPKISTFLAYYNIDVDDLDSGVDDDSNIYTIGVGYQYSPALYFEVSYQDHDGKPGAVDYEDKMFRFRTLFNF